MQFPIIDCHCHVYPDKIAEKAVDAIHNFYDIPMNYDGKYSTLVENGRKNGIVHFVVFSVATTPSQVRAINEFIAGVSERSNGIVTGLGTLHPDADSVEDDFLHLKNLGLKGVKLHPDFQKFGINDEKCHKIYELCKGNVPVMLHTGDSRYNFSNPDNLIPVLEKYPDLTVIGAHLGGWSVWDEAAEKLSKYSNFYVDCSSCFNWLDSKKIKEIIRKYGAEKILFGTDYPMWNYEKELDCFASLSLDSDEKEMIFYKNAVKLFKLDEKTICG